MFGAFTNEEVDALVAWIDALNQEPSTRLYYEFTLREQVAATDFVASLQDPACHHPVLTTRSEDRTLISPFVAGYPNLSLEAQFPIEERPFSPPCKSQLPEVVALWFVHIGLLENTINVPSRTTTPLYSHILSVLRAQAGLTAEAHIPAGMGEMTRQSNQSLVDIGLEIVSNAQWKHDHSLSCLSDVLLLTKEQGQSEESVKFVYDMLQWANRPDENLGLLVGLALAFLGLKEAVVMSCELLGEQSRAALNMIIERERKGLLEAMQNIRSMDGAHYGDLQRGYCIGIVVLEKCLGEPSRSTSNTSEGSVAK